MPLTSNQFPTALQSGQVDVAPLTIDVVDLPENILRHRWAERELVLFDNRITQHYAVDNYDGLPRRLHRVTVAGDVPAGVEGKESYAIEGDASHYTPVPAPADTPAAPRHRPVPDPAVA